MCANQRLTACAIVWIYYHHVNRIEGVIIILTLVKEPQSKLKIKRNDYNKLALLLWFIMIVFVCFLICLINFTLSSCQLSNNVTHA